MIENKEGTSLEKTVLLLNQIQLSMIAGVVFMSFVLLGTDALKGILKPDFRIDYTIVALTIFGLAMSVVMPPILRGVQFDREIPDHELLAKYQSSMIAKYALLEVPALVVIFLNQDKSIFGILALVILVIALMASFVRPRDIQEYIDQVRESQTLMYESGEEEDD